LADYLNGALDVVATMLAAHTWQSMGLADDPEQRPEA